MKVKWDVRKAAKNLNIALIPFNMEMDGKAHGYSTPDREMAIHPEAKYPVFVTLHEMGHIALSHIVSPFGGTSQKFTIMDVIWKQHNMTSHEMEAQLVALEAALLLGLEPGIDLDVSYELAYLEHFVKDAGMPSDERVAQLREAAKRIVEAGRL
ncbi:hypothetical protein MINTMi27_15570 [Mycobacterium intracellulare]|uniref:hypothetical protein n=1 Tax=Mycobacterium intracellulare TaxID=1767 RepID=UPI001927CE55|nr:hypothetical protein [Mycobacterium intracellulare]BCP41464.1 hypothetical protein MINTMi27_15570 [Mycobacterium intracellulare]